MANPKLERLMNLTAALLDTRVPLSADHLHQRVAGYPDDDVAFRRSFERDKEDLREMGIPVRIEEIPDSLPRSDGYIINADEYFLRDPGLTADELAALHLATAAVHLDGVQGLGGLWKLGGVPTPTTDDAPTIGTDVTADAKLVVLFGAMADRRVVTFRYNGAPREVEPHRLQFQRGRWYLAGRDRAKGEPRVYRLDRIDDGVVGTGPVRAFVRPDVAGPLQLDPWLTGSDEATTARILIDAAVAPAAVHELGEETVEQRYDDGSVVVVLPVTNRVAFRNLVLGFLDHAEVLSPPALRDDIAGWLRTCAGEGAP